jgi:hypothetical protein
MSWKNLRTVSIKRCHCLHKCGERIFFTAFGYASFGFGGSANQLRSSLYPDNTRKGHQRIVVAREQSKVGMQAVYGGIQNSMADFAV